MKKVALSAIFSFLVFAGTATAQSTYTQPDRSIITRPRVVVTAPKVARYIPENLEKRAMKGSTDFKLTINWKNLRGGKIQTVLIGTEKKEKGFYIICQHTDESTVCFGSGQRALDVMKLMGYEVNVLVENVNKPYVLRRNSTSVTALENIEQAKGLFNLYNDWWYDFAGPNIENRYGRLDSFDAERIYESLDLQYPEKWWWVFEETKIDSLVG